MAESTYIGTHIHIHIGTEERILYFIYIYLLTSIKYYFTNKQQTLCQKQNSHGY